MSQQIINVGATANDGTGDTLRLSQQKANLNFTELYGSKLDSVVAGTNITVDNTDPLNPIISGVGSGSGGGASVNYYINGGTSQGTIGGNAYKEMSKTAIVGTGVDFTINADGYIANFITDPADPSLLKIPGGNWNLEYYFSSSSAGGTPSFYTELYKYDGTTFTLIASNSAVPKTISNGTSIEPYYSSLAVPETDLTLTDRLAIRIYVNHSSKTITLHTQDSHLGQLITTFSTGLTALNGLTAQVQTLATGTTGTDFAISSATDTHTFNLPTASATNRGALSSTDWSTFDNKLSKNTAITGATKTKITYDANGLVTAGTDITASDLPSGIDAAKIDGGNVSNTEFSYLDGVTSSIQTQINAKQGTLTLTTTGTSGAATLVSNTLNIPQYSGGGGATKEFVRLFHPSWGLGGVAVNTWCSWPRNTSTMLTQNIGSLAQTTTTPSLGDSNFLLINGRTKLNKVSFSTRDGTNGGNLQLYIRSFTFADGTSRGSETNVQVLINEDWTMPAASTNGFKNNFTIATHTLDTITGIQIAARFISGTPTSFQGVQIILEFE